ATARSVGRETYHVLNAILLETMGRGGFRPQEPEHAAIRQAMADGHLTPAEVDQAYGPGAANEIQRGSAREGIQDLGTEGVAREGSGATGGAGEDRADVSAVRPGSGEGQSDAAQPPAAGAELGGQTGRPGEADAAARRGVAEGLTPGEKLRPNAVPISEPPKRRVLKRSGPDQDTTTGGRKTGPSDSQQSFDFGEPGGGFHPPKRGGSRRPVPKQARKIGGRETGPSDSRHLQDSFDLGDSGGIIPLGTFLAGKPPPLPPYRGGKTTGILEAPTHYMVLRSGYRGPAASISKDTRGF